MAVIQLSQSVESLQDICLEQTEVGAYFKLVAWRMQIKLLPGTNIHATVRNTLNFLTRLRETTACTHEP